MKLLNKQPNFNFMRMTWLALTFSVLAVLLSVISLIARGLNFGIDFTGGTLVELAYQQPVKLAEVRKVLREAGYADVSVQQFGTPHDVLIRIAPHKGISDQKLSNEIFSVLDTATRQQVNLRRIEFVGPQVGKELTEDGGLAMLYALIAIAIYVMLRFEWRFSVGALIALIHDVLLTLGLFSMLQLEFDLTVLAAILAVIGYSLNDTIVVFDRIRENFRRVRKSNVVEIVNLSLNQVVSRTLMTSFTTLLVLGALFFLGGQVIHGFSLALLVGVIIGTYSSVYVASVAVLMLGVKREDLMPVKKEGAGLDNRL